VSRSDDPLEQRPLGSVAVDRPENFIAQGVVVARLVELIEGEPESFTASFGLFTG